MYVVFRQSRCKTTAVDMHVITDLDCYRDRIELSFSRQLQICLKYGRDASSYLGLRLIKRTPSQYPNSEIRELLSNSEPPHQLTLSNHGAYASGWVGARHMHRPVCRTMARFALLPRP